MNATRRGHAQPETPTGPAPRATGSSTEALMLNLSRLGARVVALTAPDAGLDVGALAEDLATSLAASDNRVLLIDFEQCRTVEDGTLVWDPRHPIDPSLLVADSAGFDRLTTDVDGRTRPLFNNLPYLMRALGEDLQNYTHIIMNLPPVAHAATGLANPLALARAADAVLLVCASERTLANQAATAANELRAAGAKLVGTVLDDTNNVAIGDSVARSIERFWLLPRGLRQRLGASLRNGDLFAG